MFLNQVPTVVFSSKVQQEKDHAKPHGPDVGLGFRVSVNLHLITPARNMGSGFRFIRWVGGGSQA